MRAAGRRTKRNLSCGSRSHSCLAFSRGRACGAPWFLRFLRKSLGRVSWREQLQLFSPALLRARRRASVPTLQHSPSIHSREATRPSARPRPHLLCFNVLPWSQRASRHDSIAMAGALWIAKAHGPLRRAARAGATQIRALAPRAFISAFSCRCSVGSNSPYSHSAAGG